MQESLLQFLQQHPQWAIAISLTISIVIAVLGVIPSVFITGANILFFGFWPGIFLSFLGEAIGAAVAFVLYRKGFKKGTQKSLERFPKAARLLGAEGKEAAGLILSLRLLPFVPSGLVTFAAAVGKVTAPIFIVASSVGKIPALHIEGYAVYTAAEAPWQIKLALLAVGITILIILLRKKRA